MMRASEAVGIWCQCPGAGPVPAQNAGAGAETKIEARSLVRGEEKQALDFLNRQPLRNVILIGFIRDNGLESERNRGNFYGYFCDGVLSGVALIGHHTLLSGDSHAARYFAAAALRHHKPDIRNVLGEEDAVEVFCRILNDTTSGLRVHAVERQALCTMTGINGGISRVDGLRPVRADELEEVAQLHARTYLEWNGVDPSAQDPEGFRQRMLARIEKEGVWVVRDETGFAFKTDIVSESEQAVYLEGVWTRPDLRDSGFGSAALKNLCERLLERHPAICLFADADDERAISFYQRAGFKNPDLYCLVRYQPIGN